MKYLKLLLPFLFLAIAGCSKDSEDEPESWTIHDYSPAEVNIEILDEDGNNLFSYKYHGSLDPDNIANQITYTYKGETKPLYVYNPNEVQDESVYINSRYYYPRFFGVYVTYHGSLGFPCIRFGEFDGAEDQSESVIINWPDGTHNEIEFTSEACNAWTTMKTRVDGDRWYPSSYVSFVK